MPSRAAVASLYLDPVLSPEQSAELELRTATYPSPPPFTEGRHRFESDGRHYRLDRHGVLMTYEAPQHQWYYNATNIARYVLQLYASWREADDTALQPMLTNARWLYLDGERHFTADGKSFIIFRLPVAVPAFNVPVGATSALTSANAMLALYVAGLVSGDITMTNMAADVLPGFAATVREGGYRVPLGRRAAWFEEYAYPTVRPPRVLNGHMLVVADLAWYGSLTNNTLARNLSLIGVNGLRQTLYLYNSRPISAYDLERRGHIFKYHLAHVEELRYLYELTGVRLFARYANTWARQSVEVIRDHIRLDPGHEFAG